MSSMRIGKKDAQVASDGVLGVLLLGENTVQPALGTGQRWPSRIEGRISSVV